MVVGGTRAVPCNQVAPTLLCSALLSFALLYPPLLCSNFPPPALYNIVSSLHFIALNGELHRRCRVPAITISVYCPHCPVYCLLPPLVNCCPWMGRVPSTSPLLLLRSADIYGTAVNLPGIPHQPITFKSVLRKCPQRFLGSSLLCALYCGNYNSEHRLQDSLSATFRHQRTISILNPTLS